MTYILSEKLPTKVHRSSQKKSLDWNVLGHHDVLTHRFYSPFRIRTAHLVWVLVLWETLAAAISSIC